MVGIIMLVLGGYVFFKVARWAILVFLGILPGRLGETIYKTARAIVAIVILLCIISYFI